MRRRDTKALCARLNVKIRFAFHEQSRDLQYAGQLADMRAGEGFFPLWHSLLMPAPAPAWILCHRSCRGAAL